MMLLSFLVPKDLVAFSVVSLLFFPSCFPLLPQLLLRWLAGCTKPPFPLDPPSDYVALLNNVSSYGSALGALSIARTAFVKVEINGWDKGLCFKVLNWGSFVRSCNYP